MGASFRIKNQAFTIVELLVICVVIGILASIAIISYNGIQADARDNERTVDIDVITSALETHYNQKGSYPISPGASLDSTVKELGLTPKSVRAPGVSDSSPISLISKNPTDTSNPSISQYYYRSYKSVSPANASNRCTRSTDKCIAYEIIWRKEKDNSIQTVRSQFGW